MELTYTLQPSDYIAYQKYAAQNGSWLDRAPIPAALLASLGSFVVIVGRSISARLAKHQSFDWLPLALTLAVAVSLGLLLGLMLRWQAGRESAKNSLVRLPQTLRVDPAGLTWQHQQTCTTTLWPGVQKVDADENGVYFILDGNGVYLVPSRVFATPAAMQEFFVTATGCWKGEVSAMTEAADIWPPPPRIGN